MRLALLGLLIGISTLTACVTAPVTPSPSPSTPPSGILFGSQDAPRTSFPLDETTAIAWTAILSAPIGVITDATSVNLVISPTGTDTELFGFRQFIADPNAATLVNDMPLGRFIREPGRYVMRYVTEEGEVLAAGEFELVVESD